MPNVVRKLLFSCKTSLDSVWKIIAHDITGIIKKTLKPKLNNSFWFVIVHSTKA